MEDNNQTNTTQELLSSLIKRIQEKLKKNLGDIRVMMLGKQLSLMIHYRYDKDPFVEIPEADDSDEETWDDGEFDNISNYKWMIPHPITLDDKGLFDVEYHTTTILERLKDAIPLE